jgi:branched-chain amino acid transport system permease protein
MATTYLRRFYSSFLAHVVDIPPRLLALLLSILLVVLPLTGIPITTLFMLTTANVLAIFAASWDLLVGRTGQISLGHSVFFGVGAYGTGLLFLYLKWPLWVTIPLSLLAGALIALIIGIPCLRVRGHYLALVTLALPIILSSLILFFRDFTRGDYGIWGLPAYFPNLPYNQQYVAEFYLTLFLLFISAVIMYKIANSKIGLVFMSILDDELASKACGINITKYKLMAFTLSGMFGSLAGSVNVHLLGNHVASLASLSLTISFMVIVYTIFGGIGTIYGPIVGVFSLVILERFILTQRLEVVSSWRLIFFSVLIIVLLILWRGRGLARFVTDKLADLEEARNLDERGPKIWKKYKKKNSNPKRG